MSVSPKLIQDFEAIALGLEDSMSLYRNWKKYQYRIMATLLRSLLCDSNRSGDNSLLVKIFPSARLHPIYEDKLKWSPLMNSCVLSTMWNGFTFDSHWIVSGNIFDISSEPISMASWRIEPLIKWKHVITIYDLIKWVADKEWAHSDNVHDEKILFLRDFIIGNSSLVENYIFSIAEYISKIQREIIENKIKPRYRDYLLYH